MLQTVHFTYDFQTGHLYERAGYVLVGRVEDFPVRSPRPPVPQALGPAARRHSDAGVEEAVLITTMRTPIKHPTDPMYAEFEVHRSMICDRARTEAFKHAVDSVVRSGDVVLDAGAGSGILSVFRRPRGLRVHAVEQTLGRRPGAGAGSCQRRTRRSSG